jgi:hypothetical protein
MLKTQPFLRNNGNNRAGADDAIRPISSRLVVQAKIRALHTNKVQVRALTLRPSVDTGELSQVDHLRLVNAALCNHTCHNTAVVQRRPAALPAPPRQWAAIAK